MNDAVLEGINIRSAGKDGAPVILVHCSSSHSGQFKPYFEALSGTFRVFAPDLHGYGRSKPLPRDQQPWFSHDTGALRALIDHLGPERVHLVGHSLGAATAFMTARMCPDRVASLTLIEPVLFYLLEEAGNPLVAEGYRTAAHVSGYVRLKRPEMAARFFVEFWSGEGAWDALSEETQSYIIATVDRVADDWAGMLAGLPGQVSIGDCEALSMPVQLICGGATRASARAIMMLLKSALPGAEYHEISGAAHMAAVTDPGLFLPLIRDYLIRHTDS